MRIRIVEPRAARIDGVDLTVFHRDHVYEVDPSIATYLVVSGVAERCNDGAPALVVRTDEVMVGVFAGAQTRSDVADNWEEDGPPGTCSLNKVPGF
jgi:hypothetical protein